MAHTGFMLNEGHFDSAAVSALLQLPDFSAMQVLNELASVPNIATVSQGWGVGCCCAMAAALCMAKQVVGKLAFMPHMSPPRPYPPKACRCCCPCCFAAHAAPAIWCS